MIGYIELKKKTLQNKHSKKIKSLERQTEGLKKENQVLKKILASKLEINNENNNNIDNTWKTVKANNRGFNSIDIRNKYQPIFIHENEVTESRINNMMNEDVNEYRNAFKNNIDNNVITRIRRRTPVIN